MPRHPYIGFEGPIASGKTTHATLLAKRLACTLLLEDFPGNEFLADFYGDKERWALPMQLSFLAMRTAQLRTVVAPLPQSVLVDYSNLKDGTFAQLLLRDRELRLYDQIARAFQANVVSHDLIVYLDASNDVLLERIRNRGRVYEATIDANYLDSLRESYEKAFRAVGQLKVVRYDTSVVDLTSKSDVNNLQDTILRELSEF